MPNHVINEITFKDLTKEQIENILLKIKNNDTIDFSILVPPPINIWHGNVSKIHEETFPDTGLNWNRNNWGTKWNAYDCKIEIINDNLRIEFRTAWSPPMGWVVALYNYFQLPFIHLWMSEGNSSESFQDEWKIIDDNDYFGEQWTRSKIEDENLHIYVHKLLWGVEKFED